MAIILEQLSKFHFVILHFPVVLLSLIPVVVMVSLVPFGKIWRPTIPYFIHFGTLTAIPTAIFGRLLLINRDLIPNKLHWHANLGYATVAYMVIFSAALIIKRPDFEKAMPTWVIPMALFAGAIVTVAAHFGGETVHGSLFILFDAIE